ncbi:MAG: ATP-binding protein [Chromatiales bacterium]|nr:ATP-binding protein [Chromatiales bacterium]
MGRLFWKFFIFFWLAQLVTSIGVGTAIWLLRPEYGSDHRPEAMTERPARPFAPPAYERDEPGREPPAMTRQRPPPHKGFPRLLLPIGAGSVVSLLFAALLAWYFARPIRSLRTAFEDVANGRLGTRVGATLHGRNDELADLGTDFDHMAERLQGLLDSQRRLLHDVSHELRSPLARVQAAIDLIAQQPERSAEFVRHIERDTARMDRLVGELLTLARLDAGMGGHTAITVDLGEIIEDVAEDARLEAAPKRCRIEVSLPETIEVSGSQELLHRAIENVVRNAVRHAPTDSAVDIAASIDAARRQVVIDITDSGGGVPESDLDAIFTPFFRVDNAGMSDGYGLGLAITRRIVAAHGGGITAANRSAGGLRVTLRLPVDKTAGRPIQA